MLKGMVGSEGKQLVQRSEDVILKFALKLYELEALGKSVGAGSNSGASSVAAITTTAPAATVQICVEELRKMAETIAKEDRIDSVALLLGAIGPVTTLTLLAIKHIRDVHIKRSEGEKGTEKPEQNTLSTSTTHLPPPLQISFLPLSSLRPHSVPANASPVNPILPFKHGSHLADPSLLSKFLQHHSFHTIALKTAVTHKNPPALPSDPFVSLFVLLLLSKEPSPTSQLVIVDTHLLNLTCLLLLVRHLPPKASSMCVVDVDGESG